MSKQVKCPWCPWTGPAEEYPTHLEKHYRKEEDTITGPYTKLEEE